MGGRNFEYYSEDPELVSEMAVGWITGLQGEGVIAIAKHYTVNNQEAAPLEADNRVNGEYLTENCPLVQDLLKGEWGFQGFALSDYWRPPARAREWTAPA